MKLNVPPESWRPEDTVRHVVPLLTWRRAFAPGLLGVKVAAPEVASRATEVFWNGRELIVSRTDGEKRANPGYRAFFANGFNVTRSLVLFAWEIILEWTAALLATAASASKSVELLGGVADLP